MTILPALEWPARCCECRQVISEWSAAGFTGARWAHNTCWRERRRRATMRGRDDVRLLLSPVERVSQLELPMVVSMLLFHFGLGAALAGWALLAEHYALAGTFATCFGLAGQLIGGLGIVANLEGRRRIEGIRRELDDHGGWPGER